jgi:cell fate regulator YaaT (PSP1 superfamily)
MRIGFEDLSVLKEQFQSMEKALNVVEGEFKDSTNNMQIIAFNFGKIYSAYQVLVNTLEVYKEAK